MNHNPPQTPTPEIPGSPRPAETTDREWTPRDPPCDDPQDPIRLAVCVSGGGTTLRNLLECIATQNLNARVTVVIANKPGIGALAIAESAVIPHAVIIRKKTPKAARDPLPGSDDFSRAVFRRIRDAQADLVLLGGFLTLLEIPPDYLGKVINVHPSLIPAFCGAGYHGGLVHRAVWERGVKVTGCTVHYADNHYDSGPIILQDTVPVLDDDTPETIAARVFAAECRAVPMAVRLHAEGRLSIVGQRVLRRTP